MLPMRRLPSRGRAAPMLPLMAALLSLAACSAPGDPPADDPATATAPSESRSASQIVTSRDGVTSPSTSTAAALRGTRYRLP